MAHTPTKPLVQRNTSTAFFANALTLTVRTTALPDAPLKVFVFTYDRYDSITTAPMLATESIPHTVLCHDATAMSRFIDAGTVAADSIVATGQPKGLANNRNAALEMMDDGEWAMFLVDDLKSVSELDTYDEEHGEELPITMANQKDYRHRFDRQITMRQFLHRAQASARYGQRMNANLVGFCGINNPLYRRKKWKVNVLADGRAWMVRKTHLRFDPNAQMIDDLAWTALNIKEFGTVIVNDWVLPDCRRYTAGAYGSIDERMEQKLREAKHLVTTYPEYIAYKEKAGWPTGSHVVLRQRNKRRNVLK